MPELTVQAIEVKPGQYRWYGYPENRFISGAEAIRRLVPSIAGFHGHEGQFQPYEAVAQTLGPGIPTPAHVWWKVIEAIETPEEDIERLGARQFLTTGEFVDSEGGTSEYKFATRIGEGYDVDQMDDRFDAYETTGETGEAAELPPLEHSMEIGRSTVQIDWEFIGVSRS